MKLIRKKYIYKSDFLLGFGLFVEVPESGRSTSSSEQAYPGSSYHNQEKYTHIYMIESIKYSIQYQSDVNHLIKLNNNH